jgi:hypothetical protein
LDIASRAEDMACSSERMKIFTDYVGRRVRLTPEREAHILDYPEMVELIVEVGGIVATPEQAVLSASDPTVELLYRFKRETKVGDKWLCVVVKYEHDDAFVVTAYLTDKVKRGQHLWPRE